MSWFNILKDDGDAETNWHYDWRKREKLRAKKRNKKLMDEGVHAKTSTNFLNNNKKYLLTERDTPNFGHTSKPLNQYNTSETMLFDIFNVPIEALDQLVIPQKLVRNLRQKSNLDKLDEQKFNELMELSDKREYQELVDKLTEIFNIKLTQYDMQERAWKRI